MGWHEKTAQRHTREPSDTLERYAHLSFLFDSDLNLVRVLGDRPVSTATAAQRPRAETLFGEYAARRLRVAMEEVRRENKVIRGEELRLRLNERTRKFSFEIIPHAFSSSDPPLFLVVLFESSVADQPLSLVPATPAVPTAKAARSEGTLLIIDQSRSEEDIFRQIACEKGLGLRWETDSFPNGASPVERDPALVFLDLESLGSDPGEMSSRLALRRDWRLVWMTSRPSLDGAICALQHGALDYLSKPLDYSEVSALVQRELCSPEMAAAPGTFAGSSSLKGLIGSCPKMVQVYKNIARASASHSNVLITGETGTGKELVARAIHDHSERKERRYVTVNCAGLAETLLETELFGHVRGAFTGAVTEKEGLFEHADRGTIFLDEVGDISHSLQAKLLRVIQEGEFKRVGGNEILVADVRVIAATHRNLERLVENGEFREDLYYRLKVIPISLPPLRERRQDLPELIDYFVTKHGTRNGKPRPLLSGAALSSLYEYDWPGNIRELEHAIERAVALSGFRVLSPEDFSLGSRPAPPPAQPPAEDDPALLDAERERILSALGSTNFNKSRAASVLGISRVTLYKKVQRFNIQ